MSFAEAPSRARRRVSDNDVINSTVRTYLRAITHIEDAGDNLVCSTGFTVIQSGQKVLPRFLFYWLRSSQFVSAVVSRSVGISYPAINPDEIAQLPFPKIGALRRRSVADFLDRETAKIDDLITKKEHLTELLNERNLSFITRTVTRGLDPDASLKECQAGWFRHAPSHWTIAPLYAHYNVQLGKMLDEKQITGDQLAPYLRNVDVQWGHINIENLAVMDFDPQDRARFGLRQGDLLVCEGGDVGRSAVWSDQVPVCYYQRALHRLRPTRGDDPEFMFYVMRAAVFSGLFEGSTNQSTIGHLTAEKPRRYRSPFPPVPEQIEIVRQLEKHSRTTMEATSKITAAIALLPEYRSALVSAAVTGQLDIRKHEKKLEALG
jgi:type I restriction enzyme S subunit